MFTDVDELGRDDFPLGSEQQLCDTDDDANRHIWRDFQAVGDCKLSPAAFHAAAAGLCNCASPNENFPQMPQGGEVNVKTQSEEQTRERWRGEAEEL